MRRSTPLQAFSEKADAQDALEAMDGKTLDGQTLTVSKAGPKPTYRPQADPNENFKKVLMTTQTERENARYRKDVEKAAEKLKPRSRSRSTRRRARSRSRSTKKHRSRSPQVRRRDRGDSRKRRERSRSPRRRSSRSRS
ncbi:unnamed protein product [Durusdinium trenchii]|uniref:RRM domain-containing protein n=1 Tax=Durusdinium trenchii TaxID=1381693 RepID=A0ABP0LDF3_9DINO